MNRQRCFVIASLLFPTMLLVGCSGDNVTITRPRPTDQIDIAPQWNDVDSRSVAEEMVKDSLTFPWYNDFREKNHRKPVLVIGPVKNLSRDYIDTQLFTKDIERSFIRSGDVTIVAMNEERQRLFDEILAQQEFASVETAKRLGQATGADFMMTGRIGYIHQTSADGKRSIRYYKVDLEVINLQTTEKVWSATKEIKKDIVRKGYKP